LRHLVAHDFDAGMRVHPPMNGRREGIAIDGERGAAGNSGLIRRAKDQ
jgi:hypothetical protein